MDFIKDNLKPLLIAIAVFIVVGNIPVFAGYGIVPIAAAVGAFFLSQRYLADY